MGQLTSLLYLLNPLHLELVPLVSCMEVPLQVHIVRPLLAGGFVSLSVPVTEPGAVCCSLQASVLLLASSPTLVLDVCMATSSFCMGNGDLNSGLHTCTANSVTH